MLPDGSFLQFFQLGSRLWDRGTGDQGTWGLGDPGPMDLRTLDSNWHTLYMYIHSTCVSNHSTGMHYGMEYEILCTVESTFVVAAFIPFHSVRYQKRLLYCR